MAALSKVHIWTANAESVARLAPKSAKHAKPTKMKRMPAASKDDFEVRTDCIAIPGCGVMAFE